MYRNFYYEDVTPLLKEFEGKEFLAMIFGHIINENNLDKTLKSIEFIDKYRWFLDEVNYKKENFIRQINMNGMSLYVSNKTLRPTSECEDTTSKIQYVLAEDDNANSQLLEQITFSNLLDFFNTDFYKRIMKESISKKCKLCGTYFLQEKGFTYEY